MKLQSCIHVVVRWLCTLIFVIVVSVIYDSLSLLNQFKIHKLAKTKVDPTFFQLD